MTLSSMTGPDPDAAVNFIGQPPLIGRAPEQAALRAWLHAAQAGQGRGVLVSGEAGIGKTSLVEDLAREAESQDCLVLWGRAYDFSVTPPYGPWVELARTYQPTDDLPPFPAFLHDPQALAAVGSQEALFTRTWQFFATVAAQRPVVLILDDLHWADPESLSLLRFIAREVARHRVLILATYRSDELTRRHALYQLVPLLVREAQVARLELHPLDEAAIHELIIERYRLPEADTVRLENYLNEHAEGNPLYAGELLRTLAEDRVLSKNAAGWSLGDLSQVRLPPLLMQVIEGRLSRLSEATRRRLEVAAVIGQTVPLALWQRVSDADENGLAAVIEQGMEARLLDEGTNGTLEFSHALVREALYQGTVLVRRRGWHRAIGEALATAPNADPDTVAHHFEEAGDPKAIDWLVQAGERAQRAYAWITAATRFDAALAKLTEHDAPAVERAVLLLRVAVLLRYVDTHRALSLMDEARLMAIEAGEPGLASGCQVQAGLYRCFLGDVRAGLVSMEQGVATFESLDTAERTRWGSLVHLLTDVLVGTLVLWLAISGRLEEACRRGRRMVAEGLVPELRPGQGGSAYIDGLIGLALAEAFLGRPEAARRLSEQAFAGYQAIEHYQLLALTCGAQLEFVQLPYFPDDLQLRTWLTEAAEESVRRAQGANPALPARNYALPLLVLAGAWTEAREVASRTYGSAGWQLRQFAGKYLAVVTRDQGDATLAQHIVADTLPDGPATEPGNAFLSATLPLQRLAAELALETGDLATAQDWLEAHDRWLDWSGAVLGRAEGALGWAAFHHANGDPAQARVAAEQALAHASDPRQPLALIAVHRFLGTLDTEAGHLDSADEHLQQSLTLAAACAAPFERALTLLEIARLRAAQGQPAAARALLAEVREICTPLEALPTLARVASLEAELATTPSARSHDSYPAGLTAREVEVLQLLAQGLSNPEIAERLFLSRRTVDSHLSAIYRKLDITSRIAAARFATEHGLG